MLFFWHLVDVEQHVPKHVEKQLWLVERATPDHHQQGLQHGRQAGVFFFDDADADVLHGGLLHRLLKPRGAEPMQMARPLNLKGEHMPHF